MLAWYLLLLGIVVAWMRVEHRHRSTSRGIVSVVLGCLMFSFGLVGALPSDKVYGWLVIAGGCVMVAFGAARWIAQLVAARLQNNP